MRTNGPSRGEHNDPVAPAEPYAAPAIGERMRATRLERGIGVRDLARRIGISPSMISQIELGNVMPSVATLYAIVQELDLSLDDIFRAETPRRGSGVEAATSPPDRQAKREGPVQRRENRKVLVLDSGVRWELLTADRHAEGEFILARYEVGGASTLQGQLTRHGGFEYGYVQAGHLGVTVGFDTYELRPGDSIAFDSATPHRLFCVGDEPTEVIWFVSGRHNDARFMPIDP